MTELEFKREMKVQGWNDIEITERLKEYHSSLSNRNILPLPLEMWLQKKVYVDEYPAGKHYIGIPLI